MLEKVLIFVVFLGPLIFFHELGHFFFARLFGVRVEVFSIGFGPKILKYFHKGTEYAVSIIPLGGYVKMFGDDPFSEAPLTEEEKKVAFNHKSKWARFWIVFGGPLANLLLAYFLYAGLLASGEKVPETKVGVVAEKSILFEKGLRTGDVLIGINDEKVTSFDDLNIKGAKVEKITVARRGENLNIPIMMNLEPFIKQFMESMVPVRKPVFVNSKGEKFLASLKPQPQEINFSFEEISADFKGSGYLYKLSDSEDKLQTIEESQTELKAEQEQSLFSLLTDLELYPVDLVIRNVVMGSAADKAELRKGDIIIGLNNKALTSFEDLRKYLQDTKDGEAVEIAILSEGKKVIKKLTPETKEISGKTFKIIGVESAVVYLEPKLIVSKAESFGAAVTGALARTWDGIAKTFSGYKKLITREVSLNNIGGPLAIGKVASDSLNISLSMFFRLMAIMSINLGIINLFPIPVLDGGHIMFLIFETFNGGPLSRRKLEIAQKLGLSVLFFLIFVALFNDITRLF